MLIQPIKIRVPEFNDTKLLRAKECRIEDLYKGDLRRSGKTLMGICPAHQEHTPSFAIYPETNTCYCFACGFKGDVIAFYMKINNCDFKTALEELSDL